MLSSRKRARFARSYAGAHNQIEQKDPLYDFLIKVINNFDYYCMLFIFRWKNEEKKTNQIALNKKHISQRTRKKTNSISLSFPTQFAWYSIMFFDSIISDFFLLIPFCSFIFLHQIHSLGCLYDVIRRDNGNDQLKYI